MSTPRLGRTRTRPSAPPSAPPEPEIAALNAYGRLHAVRVDFSLHAHVDLPVARAWSLVTDLSRWWPGASLEARVGGRFVEHWTDESGAAVVTTGEVVDLGPPALLRLSWRDEAWPAETVVEFHLEDLPGDRTKVTITHGGWDRLPDGTALAAAHEAGWRHHLDALARQAVEGTAC